MLWLKTDDSKLGLISAVMQKLQSERMKGDLSGDYNRARHAV